MYRYNRRSPYIKDYTLSEIQFKNNKWYPPDNIIEDANLDKEEYDNLDEINFIRSESMNSCDYYKAYDLPYIPYVISKDIICNFRSKAYLNASNENIIKNLKTFIKKYILDYPFVKLCSLSPKDCCNCIFTPEILPEKYQGNIEIIRNKLADLVIMRITKESDRCYDWRERHLVMKKVRNMKQEYRCLWINDKLRAVITKTEPTENEKVRIKQFFEKYKYNLPHTVCVEVCDSILEDEEKIISEVIELNPLGADLNCGIDPFKWEEDGIKLYQTNETIFRYYGDDMDL